MSKHLGNILQPIPLMDQHGADAVRWFMAAGGSPWAARRVGHGTIQEVVRKTLLTYWNTVAFQALYARTAGWAPSAADPAPADRPVLDRWLLGELHALVDQVTQALESYDTQRAGKLLSAFVDDLSNWYVRRSRRRFWQGDTAALRTLHEVVETVTRLMAPLTPFITERVWQDLVVPVAPDAPESVHLSSWPEADAVRRSTRSCPQQMAAGPPAGGARPGHPRRVGRQDPPAAVPRAGRRDRASTTLDARAARADHRGAERRAPSRRSPRSAARWSTPPPRPTSARWASGSARACRRSRRPSPPPTPPRCPLALRDGHRLGGGGRRDGHAGPGRGHHHRDPARGLVGGVRLRRHGRPRPGDHPGAAAGGPGPRRDPADPGGPQEQRPGRRRPHRACAGPSDGRRTSPRPWPSTPP